MGIRGLSGQELRALAPLSTAHDARRAPPEVEGGAHSTPAAPTGLEGREAPERLPAQDEETSRTSPRIQRGGTRLRIDEASKRVIAQILDNNNQVIKQIPPEELLKIAARFRELRGVLFDENA